MNLQLANEVCQAVYVAKNRKVVTITAPILKDNVQVYCIQQFDNGDPGYIGYLGKQQKSFPFDFTKSTGKINFYAMLLPTLVSKSTDKLSYDFRLGMGAGTGEDFDDTSGAALNIKFAQGNFTPSYAPYTGTSQSMFYMGEWNPPQNPLPFLLNINHAVFQGQVQNQTNTGVTFTIDADAEKRTELEQNVWIHFFDGSGKLLAVADTQNNTYVNNVCNFPYKQGGLQFAAFIGSQKTADNKFTFAIGDPQTDAVVTITEE